MAEITREDCIKEFKRLTQIKGEPPKFKEFCKETKFSEHYISKFFKNGFSELMEKAGFQPRLTVRDIPKIPPEKMWQSYADIIRKLKHPPSKAEWTFNGFKPVLTNFTRKFNCRFSEIPLKFRNFAKDKPEYADTLNYLPKSHEVESAVSFALIQQDDFHLFIPPIIQNLQEIEDPAIFEKQVGICFQLLGFKTDRLGQGQGQNPDGIASRPKDGYAIIYDAKSHQEGYSIPASDRRAAEQYIEDHRADLERDGVRTFFFAFVARSFNSESKKAIQAIREKTNVTAVLLTLSALIRLTAAHIENPYDFDHAKLKSLLFKGGQIDEADIALFLNGTRKPGAL